MELTILYPWVAGGVLLVLLVIRVGPFLRTLRSAIALVGAKHLLYPTVSCHGRPCTWSPADALTCLAYLAVNVLFLVFGGLSAVSAGRRAGVLALMNLGLPYLSPSLNLLAYTLGLSLKLSTRMHFAAGWMTGVLLAVHVAATLLSRPQGWSVREEPHLHGLIGAIATAVILALMPSVVRRRFYEPFARLHQALAVLCAYCTWRHLPSEHLLPRLYLCIPLAIGSVSLCAHLVRLVHANGTLPPRLSNAVITCDPSARCSSPAPAGIPLTVRIMLPKPLKIDAGQYVNLWLPTASLLAWSQTHPFMVTSWSPERQEVLELLVQSRKGLTSTLRARVASSGRVSLPALIDGPYGMTQAVDGFESVLVIATDFGIAGVISYMTKLVYGFNTGNSQVRRLRLVWEVHNLDIAIAAQPFLNGLLNDDILDDGYILDISFYMPPQNPGPKGFGRHRRVTVQSGRPNYNEIISAEATGQFSRNVEGTQWERGKTLVIASVSPAVRNVVRGAVRMYLDRQVQLHETEYQP
ncbi:rerric reductase like transmembrane component [Penicillium herquei]|nr:rerric reductase like transmembrane component [Penicillium herquei]